MTKVLAFMAFKGGVGKTTSATNVAGALANAGKSVLLIDADLQGNATLGMGFNPDSAEGHSLYELLHKEISLESSIIQTNNPNIDIIASTLDLGAMDMDLIDDMNAPKQGRIWNDQYNVFQPLINEIKQKYKYDYIIIDSGPSLSFFASTIIRATEIFMIPIQFARFGYRGTKKFINEIKRIRQDENNYQAYVFGTFYHNRQNVSADILERAKNELPFLGVTFLDTKIPKTVNYENAQSYYNSPLTLVEPNSPHSFYYKKLVQEVGL